MSQKSLSKEQQQKLESALEIAQLAEAKARSMSERAKQIATKYQQHLFEVVESTSKRSI